MHGSGLAVAALFIAAWAYAGATPAILGLATVLGIFAAIASPAEFALVPAIVPVAGMRRANGWIDTARSAGFMCGPPAGGAVVAAGGVAHGTKNVLIRTLIHEQVPERLHGRTYAAYNGLRNGAELFALALGGVLVATVGAHRLRPRPSRTPRPSQRRRSCAAIRLTTSAAGSTDAMRPTPRPA